jgi:hypothetical protein
MAEPAAPFKYPSLYSPGQVAFNNNAEMSNLLSMFAGPMLPLLTGANNFLPHMMPSQGLMDQYMMRQYQNQTRISAFSMAGAGNQDVAKRLLAMRSGFTDDPASELNKQQAEQFAGLINNPITKAIAGAVMGPENLEAMLHGRKGDVAALNNVANQIGFFRNDPSGAKRMDAQSLEDFSRGVYSHLYEEGGNSETLERSARTLRGPADTYNANEDVVALKKQAGFENRTVVSDDEIQTRAQKRLADKELSEEDVAATYKKFVLGDEKDPTKQLAELGKFDEAIKALDQTIKSKSADKGGLLGKDEVTVEKTIEQARENRLGQMHGFMAGQAGQIAEQMFQRGMLPQAIGAMTPAERVKLIADDSKDQDPATRRRLAEEFGKRDLMARDPDYANLTPEKQREVLAANMSEGRNYSGKIDAAMTAIKDFNEGKGGSVETIEKMEGFEAVAGNVDAKRSASAIKKYAGAVAAVREIFGDNGNPNAPMPALLAALDQLSQGAAGQMDPRKIETSLRAMQQVARESGIGFEQMAGMSAQMGAMGDMLGISKSQTIHNQVNAMAMVKTMRDSGAFSQQRFGAMSQAEALNEVGRSFQAGEASDNSRAMGALASLYNLDQNADPGKRAFAADSEFVKAMEAYTNPSSGGKYTVKDADGNLVEKDIFEIVGREGPQALQRMFKDAGGTESQFAAAFRNPDTQQNAVAGSGLLTQKHEMLRDINNRVVSGMLHTSFDKAGIANSGMVADTAGYALSELVLNSAMMKPEEQVKHVQDNMEATFKAAFQRQGKTEAEADRLAKQATQATLGSDPAKQQQRVAEIINESSAFVYEESGLNMQKQAQKFANGTPEKAAKEAQRAATVAQRKAETGLNFNSQPLARVSDYLLKTGEKNGKVTFDGLFGALANLIPEDELRANYTRGMEGGLNFVQEELDSLNVNEEFVSGLVKEKDDATLKKLAGVDDKTTVVDDEEFDKRYAAKFDAALKDDKTVTEAFKRLRGDTKLSVDEQRKELSTDERFQTEQKQATLGPDEISRRQLGDRALRESEGKFREIEGEAPEVRAAREQRREDLQTVRASFFQGADSSKLNAGVHSALRLFGVDATEKKDGKTLAAELTSLINSSDTDPKKEEAHKTNLANRVAELAKEKNLTQEQQKTLTDTFEAQRTGVKIDPEAVGLEMAAAAGSAQQAAQQIANASIDATNVTIKADKVDGVGKPDGAQASSAATDAAANAPAADALPKTGASAGPDKAGATTAAAASKDASAAAQNTAAAGERVAATPPPSPSGSGNGELTVVSGKLKLENLEAGVLEVMAKQGRPPAQTPGNGPGIGQTA